MMPKTTSDADWQKCLDGWAKLGRLTDELLAEMRPDEPDRAGVEQVRRGIQGIMAAFDERSDA